MLWWWGNGIHDITTISKFVKNILLRIDIFNAVLGLLKCDETLIREFQLSMVFIFLMNRRILLLPSAFRHLYVQRWVGFCLLWMYDDIFPYFSEGFIQWKSDKIKIKRAFAVCCIASCSILLPSPGLSVDTYGQRSRHLHVLRLENLALFPPKLKWCKRNSF